MKISNAWDVPNQFIIYDGEGNTYFQSYDSLIAKKDRYGKIWLSDNWNCSVTTSKYRSRFLGENTAETKAKIKSGEYTIVDDLTKTDDVVALDNRPASKQIDSVWVRYEAQVFIIAEEFFARVVKPFCEKQNLHFASGNGTWSIYGVPFLTDNTEAELKLLKGGEEVYELCQTVIPGMDADSLGSLMPNGRV